MRIFLHSLFSIIIIGCCVTAFSSCTKYVAGEKKSNTTTTSSSGSSLPGPLPGGGSSGSGSGSSGSGSSGSSGSGSGNSSSGSNGSGNGGNTSGSNTSSIQVLDYTNTSNTKFWANNNSISNGGSYTTINAGNVAFKMTYNNSDVLNANTYSIMPNSYYSFVTFAAPGIGYDATVLHNGTSTPAIHRAFVRFINLDPTSKTRPVSCTMKSYMDNIQFNNRIYLDNKTDSTLTDFRDIYATTGNITLTKNNKEVINFQFAFDQEKKYTIFTLADNNGFSKIYIARHN